MVLDAKAMSWAARHELDTAKLKKAKVPLYGKWYFPEIPANTAMINLDTGERRVFAERMLAGEVIWVAERDLRQAGLVELPPEEVVAEPVAVVAEPTTVVVEEPEPLLAMSRPASPEMVERHAPLLPLDGAAPDVYDRGDPSGIHLPKASIAPFVLAMGVSLALMGIVVHVLLLVVGVLWALAGAIAWVRIGLLEAREGAHH